MKQVPIIMEDLNAKVCAEKSMFLKEAMIRVIEPRVERTYRNRKETGKKRVNFYTKNQIKQ